MQSARSASVAPSILEIGSANTFPKMRNRIPRIAPVSIRVEKSARASFPFPSPNFFAIIALPPVANMTPTAMRRLSIGYAMLSADNALVPTNLDTKIPSTIVYKDMNTIMTIVGKAKCNKERNLKSFEIEFDKSNPSVSCIFFVQMI